MHMQLCVSYLNRKSVSLMQNVEYENIDYDIWK